MKPLISYYGGKQRLASKIIPYLEAIPHTVRVIPFAGGLGVESNWERPKVFNNDHYRVAVNDIDGGIITLYRVARDEPDELQRLLEMTPYSQSDYSRSIAILRDKSWGSDLERAWAVFVNLNCSFASKKSAGWATAVKSQNPAAIWQNRIKRLGEVLPHFEDVHIGCEDALRFIERWDSPQSLFYLDPPYPETDQGHYKGYTIEDFSKLCERLDSIAGSYVMSCYPQVVPPKSAQRQIDFSTTCSASGKGKVGKNRDKSGAATSEELGNRKRTDSIWICDRSHKIGPDLVQIAIKNAPRFQPDSVALVEPEPLVLSLTPGPMPTSTLEPVTTAPKIDPQTIDLAQFPSAAQSSLKSWIDAIGRTLWNPHHKKIIEFFKTPCPKYTDVLFSLKARNIHNLTPLPGWSKLGDHGFESVSESDLPMVMVFDAETVRAQEDSPYKPFLAFAWGDGCYWVWLPESQQVPWVIPFPPKRIVIGQNSTAYDSRLFSCEYVQENFLAPNTVQVDTFCLATMVCGLSNQQKTAHEQQQSQIKSGKGAKEWVSRASPRDLASLCEFFCGIEISKSVRKDGIETKFEKDFNFHRLPTDVLEYCAQDVWATFHLAEKLFARVDNDFFTSPVSWWGVQELSQSRFHLKDYDDFLEQSEKDYQVVKAKNAEFIKAIATKELLRGDQLIRAFIDSYREAFEAERDAVLSLADERTGYFILSSPKDAFESFLESLSFQQLTANGPYTKNNLTFDTESINYGTGWDTALKKGGSKLKTKLINFLSGLFERDRKALIKRLFSAIPPALKDSPLDWSRLTTGDNKGQIRWVVALSKTDYEINRDVIVLLQLEWKDEPIYWEPLKTEKGTTGTWRTDSERLPHPGGPDKNLDSPLCKDYLVHAASGDLKSKIISKERLIELFENLISIAQWTSFRKRLGAVYRLPVEGSDNLVLTTSDIVPIGTVTRRVTSPVWQVSPKPSEKIGSGLMRHVSVPEGFSIVGADFDQEESWMATVLTDAKAGKIGSNPWCQAVLDGDKDKGTDDHSLTAKQLEIVRSAAKQLNFSAQYIAGLSKLAISLSLNLKQPLKETLTIAANFLYYKKGDRQVYKQLDKQLRKAGCSLSEAWCVAENAHQNFSGASGVQKTTFETLAGYADTPNIRTALLGVKIPDSLNAAFVKDEFFTTRNNWQIQSPCVDVLHCLLTIVRAFCIEYAVEYWFIYAVHDSVFFAVRQGQEPLFEAILQRAHQLVKQLTYEQALKHANSLKMPGQQLSGEGFKCPESQFWFSEINVGQTVAEVI